MYFVAFAIAPRIIVVRVHCAGDTVLAISHDESLMESVHCKSSNIVTLHEVILGTTLLVHIDCVSTNVDCCPINRRGGQI